MNRISSLLLHSFVTSCGYVIYCIDVAPGIMAVNEAQVHVEVESDLVPTDIVISQSLHLADKHTIYSGM